MNLSIEAGILLRGNGQVSLKFFLVRILWWVGAGFAGHPMSRCAFDNVLHCICRQNDKMHGPDASYYPKLGFFRFGRRIYNVASCRFGGHFWHAVVNTPAHFSGVTVAVDRVLVLYHLLIDFEAGDGRGVAYSRIPPVLRGVTPIVHLWRIQRAVRRFLARRFQARSLALMMALHDRLGALSLIGTLPEDVIRHNIKGS